MQETQFKEFIAKLGYLFTRKHALGSQTKTQMRPLTDNELQAVAGGPECEVGGGVG